MQYGIYSIYREDGHFTVSWTGPNGMACTRKDFADVERAQAWCDEMETLEAAGK